MHRLLVLSLFLALGGASFSPNGSFCGSWGVPGVGFPRPPSSGPSDTFGYTSICFTPLANNEANISVIPYAKIYQSEVVRKHLPDKILPPRAKESKSWMQKLWERGFPVTWSWNPIELAEQEKREEEKILAEHAQVFREGYLPRYDLTVEATFYGSGTPSHLIVTAPNSTACVMTNVSFCCPLCPPAGSQPGATGGYYLLTLATGSFASEVIYSSVDNTTSSIQLSTTSSGLGFMGVPLSITLTCVVPGTCGRITSQSATTGCINGICEIPVREQRFQK